MITRGGQTRAGGCYFKAGRTISPATEKHAFEEKSFTILERKWVVDYRRR